MKINRITNLIACVVACLIIPATGVADESSTLAVLASSEATLYEKAMACDELGRIGTAKAVPVLAKLLADEKLHDYARDGLERIKDPAAGQALLEALTTLKDGQRVGVIITLGDRREEAAAPALAKIATDKDESKHAVGAALSSLAQIASNDALKAIRDVLAKGKPESKVSAARAALAAVERLEKDGRKRPAERLRKAVAAAEVPAYIKKVAESK